MKAMVLRKTGGPEMLQLEHLEHLAPGPNSVLIRVAACGICFHDIVTRNGTLKAGISLPLIPGHEIAGTIAAVGTNVTDFTVGDRVATTQRSHICGCCLYCRTNREPLCDDAQFLGDAGLNGGYAECVTVAANTIVRVPDNVDLASASIAACAIGTCLHAVREVGRVQAGESVLVTGAGGGLGIHAVQVARLAGALVIAQTTSAGKARAIRDAGADIVIVTERGEDFSSRIRQASGGPGGGHGVDVAIDTVGTPVFTGVRRSLAKGGRWVLVGQLTGDFVPFNPAQLFLKSISMLSATSTTRAELRDVLGLIARGSLRPVIAETLPLEQAAKAHHLVEGGQMLGRIVLEPRP
jgi:acryloyl-coenzyme A reductase